ncbi:hypothetical protein AKJ56_01790 [candidate division MSBL1 archaeon SCGC-AAA382N08]|uniref:Uncharacterized protein n=1 Tax=candidate division MSBL1 archaeon SCGC-AAA382N08 TaxID=1698285 RepID=A0A133VNY0_9EURY|nr:hypothetical protein AKJ56_01790 [candidate division MSBL1 archaeon SCGC-AAA382N08]
MEEEHSIELKELEQEQSSGFKKVYYWLRRKFNFLKNLPHELKLAYQRARYGYDQENWWQIDYNFLQVTIPQLKDLKEKHRGTPSEMTEEEWERTLQEIIDGFEDGKKAIDLEFEDLEQGKQLRQNLHHSLKLFNKYFFDLWD